MTNQMMRVAGRSENGTAVGLRTDDAGTLSTSIKNQIGIDYISIRRSGELIASARETMTTTDVPTIIEFMEWSTKSPTLQLTIAHNGDGGLENADNVIGLASLDGSAVNPIRVNLITTLGAGPFEIVEHNVNTNTYKYRLKAPLYFPKGVIIQLRNNATSSINAAVAIQGRSF